MIFNLISCRSQQQLNSLDDAATSLEPERMTPLKFTSTHSSASFQDGLLVCVKQKYMANNEIQNNVHILKFGELTNSNNTILCSTLSIIILMILFLLWF